MKRFLNKTSKTNQYLKEIDTLAVVRTLAAIMSLALQIAIVIHLYHA